MSTLLSAAHRGGHRRDEEAAMPPSAHHTQQTRSRWPRPFGSSANTGNQHARAVEMSPHPAASIPDAHQLTSMNSNLDLEQGAFRHERATSGRSILSAVSIPSFAALRQRDRDQERRRQTARVQAEQPSSASNRLPTFGGGGGNPLAPVMLPQSTTDPANSNARSTDKKSRSSRREREEAATLFGPNLANYFGSGISSSGAVSSHGAGVPRSPPVADPISPIAATSSPQPHDAAAFAAPIANPVSSAPPNDNVYPQGSTSSRRARLGSRGRARGASLSGLSMMSLGAESVTSLGGINTERTLDTTQASGMMQGSTADLIDQLNRDGPATDGKIAMSEGVDITTLQRWIQRSTGVADNTVTSPAANPASSLGGPVCTTLQSYVNLKRNTLKLSTRKDATLTAPIPTKIVSDSDDNLLHCRGSFTVLPTLPYAADASTPSRDHLPEPTHSLYFEYDCAAPYASVQIFIRASRKHGSWVNWQPSAGTVDPLSTKLNADGSPACLAQLGPPPHVLGWPVHVAKLSKGFGIGHTAEIPLHLQYYAPPKAKKLGLNGADGDLDDKKEVLAAKRDLTFKPAQEPPTPAPIPETPRNEFQRRLGADADADDADDENGAANARAGGRTSASAAQQTDLEAENRAVSLATEGVTAQPAIEEETKEQRLAREKAERETLKVAIVVEALDENARPLREPNLQTSYLRLTSLPAKKSVAERLSELAQPLDTTAPAPAPPVSIVEPRIWSSQIEGQEAEIGPHRFQLQELYGLSSKPPAVAPAPAAGEEADGDDDGPGAGGMAPMDMEASNGSECLICLSSPPTTLLLPCTHGLCLECAVQLRDSVVGIRQAERRRGRTPRRKYACPVCRRAYTSMLHLSKADEKLIAQQNASSAADIDTAMATTATAAAASAGAP